MLTVSDRKVASAPGHLPLALWWPQLRVLCSTVGLQGAGSALRVRVSVRWGRGVFIL